MTTSNAKLGHNEEVGRAAHVDVADPAGPNWPKVEVHGVRFEAVTEAEIVEHVADCITRQQGGRIITPNVDIVRQLNSASWAPRLTHGAIIVADGMPIIWASRLAGNPLPERIAGSSLIWSMSEAAARDGRRIFLLGGDPGAAEAAATALLRKYPSLMVAGTLCPPWGFDKDKRAIQEIGDRLIQAQPDIVFVGLGFPKQDVLAQQLERLHPDAWYLGCGAAFSFAGGVLRRAPMWAQRLGLEWLYRFRQEPLRLARRYFVHGIPYALSVLARAAWLGLRRPDVKE